MLVLTALFLSGSYLPAKGPKVSSDTPDVRVVHSGSKAWLVKTPAPPSEKKAKTRAAAGAAVRGYPGPIETLAAPYDALVHGLIRPTTATASLLAPAPSRAAANDVEEPNLEKDVARFGPEARQYWHDPRIHTFGNIGFGGRVHSFIAPLATYMIDRLSYGGVDVRGRVLESIPAGAKVLDMCCGVGFSTAPGAHGIDTSPEMLDVAKLRRPDATFAVGNAETYGEDNEYDVVTVMFGTHEMPPSGRRRVIANAQRVARKEVIILDIDPDFHETLKKKPMQGAGFLSGEPYVLNYLEGIDRDIDNACPLFGFGKRWQNIRVQLLPKHVAVWRLRNDGTSDGGFWGI